MWLYCVFLLFLEFQLLLGGASGHHFTLLDNLNLYSQMVKVSTSLAKAVAFRAVILGAPGSGKGTVSSRIVKVFGVTHISSGDKLREHVTRGTSMFILLYFFIRFNRIIFQKKKNLSLIYFNFNNCITNAFGLCLQFKCTCCINFKIDFF